MRIAACVLILAAGCGGSFGEEVSRVLPTEKLREACLDNGWWTSDADIQAQLIAYDDFRAQGVSRGQMMNLARTTCLSLQSVWSVPCSTCETILVDHVYGD